MEATIIKLDQPTAAAMTTFKALETMYRRRDPVKYREAIDKNRARYRNEMDQLLVTKSHRPVEERCTQSIN